MRLLHCRTKNEVAEWFAIKLAWMLPRRVALWAMMRVAAHATTGKWGHVSPCDLKWSEMHDRWEHPEATND